MQLNMNIEYSNSFYFYIGNSHINWEMKETGNNMYMSMAIFHNIVPYHTSLVSI